MMTLEEIMGTYAPSVGMKRGRTTLSFPPAFVIWLGIGKNSRLPGLLPQREEKKQLTCPTLPMLFNTPKVDQNRI
jgi:hypothetical protein